MSVRNTLTSTCTRNKQEVGDGVAQIFDGLTWPTYQMPQIGTARLQNVRQIVQHALRLKRNVQLESAASEWRGAHVRIIGAPRGQARHVEKPIHLARVRVVRERGRAVGENMRLAIDAWLGGVLGVRLALAQKRRATGLGVGCLAAIVRRPLGLVLEPVAAVRIENRSDAVVHDQQRRRTGASRECHSSRRA